MDTKERILKFLLGRAISRKDYDEAKAQYESAFEGASDEQKQMAAAYLQSVNNKQSANPRSNKHARHTGAEAYRIATTMLNGTFDPAAVVSPLNTESGIDTRRKDYGRAGNVASDFYLHNQGNAAKSNLIQPSNGTGRYFFEATKGLDRIGERAGTTTRGDLVRGYAQGLLNNIRDAQAQEGKSAIYGKVDGMYDDIAKLETILGSDVESDNTYNALLDIAGKYEDGSTWKNWFGDYLPKMSEIDKRKAALMRENGLTEYDLSDQSEWARNLAKNKGYNFFKDKEGNIRIYNKDYTDQIKNILEYNQNFNDRNIEGKGFGHALISDADGNVYLGDSRSISNDSPFAELWNSKLSADRDARNNKYWDIDYQQGKHDSESPYLQALEKQFGSFKGTDVSSLFQGDDKIFVTGNTPGQSYYDKDDYFGGITFNNNSKFYKVGDDGTVQEVSWDAIKDKYNWNGWQGEGNELLGTRIDLDLFLNEAGESSIDLNSDMGGRTFWTALLEAYGLDTIAPAALGAALGIAAPVGAEKAGYGWLSSWALKEAVKNLGKDASEKAIKKEAMNIAKAKIAKAVREGTLKGVVKKAAISSGVRAGIHGALASTGIGALIGAGLGLTEAGIRYANYDNISEDIPGFVHNLLGAVANSSGQLHTKLHGIHNNAQLLQNLDYNNKKSEYTKFLFQLFNLNPDLWNQLSQQEKNTFIAMKRDFNRGYTSLRRVGGKIIRAAKGTVLNGAGEPLGDFAWQNPDRTKSNVNIAKLREIYRKSSETGYGDDIYRKQASEEKMFNGNGKMSTADALRISTMAQDVASIVASFVPGAGTGVAAGLGVTALGTDLVADVLDPAVSAGEVVKNAAINAGFAGLGLIPGAKMSKVVKNIVKYAPKIMTAAAGLGIAMDESTQKTFAKLGDGTQKLNREDWRNLSHVLSLVAAGTRGIKGDIARYKVKKGIVKGDELIVKGANSTIKGQNGEDLPLKFSSKQVKAVNEELGKIKGDEVKDGKVVKTAREKALEILTRKNEDGKPGLGLTQEQADAVLKQPTLEKGITIGKYKVETEEATNAGKSYDNLRTIWNKEAQDVESSSKIGRWFANKLGGGDYTAKQRAILENLENLENTGLMEYTGKYNPIIDWKNLRRKSGTTRMAARPIEDTPKEQKKILELPEWKRNPQERRNSSVENSYESQRSALQLGGEEIFSQDRLNVILGDILSIAQNNPRLAARRINIAINYLGKFNTPEARERIKLLKALRLNLQPSLPNRSNIGQNGQLLIPFKDGGKVNYQKLRK